MKQSGMFWHIHHDVLVEHSDNIQERIDYINKEKPKNEVETRLKLLKPVTGKLPEELIKAYKARDKAYKAKDKAYKAWDKACDKAWDKAYKACDKAWDKAYKADKAWDKYKSEIEALHEIECPNCPWNGVTIFPKVKP